MASNSNVNRNYSVNPLNQYTAAGSTSFSYDANGNLTGDGTWTYTYDAENRLTNATSSSVIANLSYDPIGRLYKIAGSNIGDVSFVLDGGEIAGMYAAGTGALKTRYVFGPGVDEPIVEYSANGSRTWLMSDERGSIVARTDSTGNAGTINTYDEYGIPGSGNQGRYQYTGQAFLYEIGLQYSKARIYSPTLGRFLQTDPIGYGDGMNWYAYTHNDPVNGSDPSGLADPTGATLAPGYVMCAGPGCTYNPNVPGSRVTVTGYRPLSFTSFSPNPADGGGASINCLDGGCDLSGLDDGGISDGFPGPGPGYRPPSSFPTPPNAPDNGVLSCGWDALKKEGAGAALDAASIIPGGGDAADVARLAAGSVSLTISMATHDQPGMALGAAGTGIAVADGATTGMRATTTVGKDALEAIPIVGTVVGVGSLLYDGYKGIEDFRKCRTRG